MRLKHFVAALVVGVACWTLPLAAQTPQDALGFGENTEAPAPSSDAARPSGAQAPQDALGFGESTEAPASSSDTPAVSQPTAAESMWSYLAWLRLQTALTPEITQPSRIAKLRTVLGAQVRFETDPASAVRFRAIAAGRLEYDLAYELHRDAWDEATLDVYEFQLLANDAYLALGLGPFELSAGKQFVNLGQGEVLGVLDTVNPRDQREPAASDPEELRLSILMTRATLALGPHRIEAFVVHEPWFGLLPPPLGQQSALRKLLLEGPAGAALANRDLRYEHVPGRDPTNWSAIQPYGRISLVAPALDLSFIVASLLEPLGIPSLPSPAEFSEEQVNFPVYHPRFTRFGQAGTLTFGAFLLRWEAAFDLDRPLALRELDSQFLKFSEARSNQLQGLLGLSYIPSVSTNMGLEVQKAYVFDNPVREPMPRFEPLWPLEALQLALRFDQRFLRERASFQVMLLLIGVDPFNAFVARTEIGYALSDGLSMSVGCVLYWPSASEFGPFYGFEDNDRVFANLRWDFQPE